MTRLSLLLALAALSTLPAHAQSGAATGPLLTRAEVEAHMETSVFCYYPDDRTACGWAELYTEQNADHAVLVSASATWDEPMEVMEFELDWRGDALCIPYEDQGLRAMWQSEGYRFPFNLAGLETLSAELLPARREELREGSPREFCFQYSNDPANPGRLLQHVFREGIEDAEQDPVVLIPRFASGVAIRPN